MFGAAVFHRPLLALIIPLLSLFLSDLYINNVVYADFYDRDRFVWFGSEWVYLAFILIIGVGRWLLHRRITAGRVGGASLLASAVFFLVTNFGVWVGSGMYPHTFTGLLTCYAAGIPFFGNTLLGDLLYSAALFGGYAWATRYWGQPQQAQAAQQKD